MNKLYTAGSVLLMLIILIACDDDGNDAGNGPGSKEYASQLGDNISHNAGYMCMTCHSVNGESDILFSTAGTVYETDETTTADSAKVLLRTKPNSGGSVVATLWADRQGNFFTTEVIDFNDGLYPHVLAPSGEMNYMPSAATIGACNSCHDGSDAPRINLP